MESDSGSRTGSVLLLLLRDPTDRQSWNAFVNRYAPKIYGWCRGYGLQEADAEDVTQDVLLRLVRKLRTFTYDPQKGQFRSWLKTLTHHAWYDHVKARRTSGCEAKSGILERLEELEAREDLLEALAEVFDLELLAEAQARVQLHVSARDWQIFEGLAVEGRSGPELARELGMTVSAVLVAKGRVQKRLRAEIERLEGRSPQARKAEA
jgi:RNA polymerase sigma-70 factor (ECF subfamily)